MKINIYQIDAFTQEIFKGNPAAVCPLDTWLPDQVMQQIAQENNLSETAFIVNQSGVYHIRWFTPTSEVNLCGHATLASGYVIANYLEPNKEHIDFYSPRSGPLKIKRNGDVFCLDFPALIPDPCVPPIGLLKALGINVDKNKIAVFSSEYYLVIVENQTIVEDLQPNFQQLLDVKELTTGVIVSAPGQDVDFVSRFFAPALTVPEDPVTGSAHCIMTPYWANVLNKNKLSAKQLSQRGGEIQCELVGNRVHLYGHAVPYMIGQIEIN